MPKICSLQNSDKTFLIDEEDFERCSKIKWYLSPQGYIYGYLGLGVYRRKSLSRFILKLKRIITSGVYVDHIDNNPLNNCKSNLRICSNSQNNFNKIKINKGQSSKFKCVYWSKNTKKWRVKLCINYKNIHGGLFQNEIDAAIKANELMKKYHGEFAVLNQI